MTTRTANSLYAWSPDPSFLEIEGCETRVVHIVQYLLYNLVQLSVVYIVLSCFAIHELRYIVRQSIKINVTLIVSLIIKHSVGTAL